MLGKVTMFLNPDPNPAILAISGETLTLSAPTLALVSATSNATALAPMRNPPQAGEGSTLLNHEVDIWMIYL